MTTETTAKRKEQNRRAQQAFRKRRKEKTEKLMAELDQSKQKDDAFNELRSQLEACQAENATLKVRQDREGSAAEMYRQDVYAGTNLGACNVYESSEGMNDTWSQLEGSRESSQDIDPRCIYDTSNGESMDRQVENLFPTESQVPICREPVAMSIAGEPEDFSLASQSFFPSTFQYSPEWLLSQSLAALEKSEQYAVHSAEWWKLASEKANQKASMLLWYQGQTLQYVVPEVQAACDPNQQCYSNDIPTLLPPTKAGMPENPLLLT